MMVSISILSIVIGLLYFYYNNGWKLFDKNIGLGKIQSNSRAALEQMSYSLKQSSRELIYTSSSYNINVPLPEDFLYGKPYIYFALAQQQNYSNDKKKSEPNPIPKYDYYLYYIARAKDKDGDFSVTKAKLKLFLIKNQDGAYTREHSKDWPFLPPDLEATTEYNKAKGTYKSGFVSAIQREDLSEEFAQYKSEFDYNFYTSNYNNLFEINVVMIDPDTKSKIEFHTTVSPRN